MTDLTEIFEAPVIGPFVKANGRPGPTSLKPKPLRSAQPKFVEVAKQAD